MFDFEIAFYLYKMSRILEIFEDNKYKSNAYFTAGMAIDSYSVFAQKMYRESNLKSIEGIGDSSARIVKEVIETGRCAELEELEKKHRIDDYSLILSHGISSKIIKKLFLNDVKSVSRLDNAISMNSTILNEFGKAERNSINMFVAKSKKINGHFLYSYVHCLRKELLDLINVDEENPLAIERDINWCEKPTDISLICKSSAKSVVFDLLSESSRYHSIINESDSKITCITSFGVPIEIFFSNSFSAVPDIQPILRGDLHMHTKLSDGKHSVKEMAENALQLGREYIGISDHSYSLKIARGISEVDALQQIEEITSLKMKGIKVLSSIEVEILKDGTLDFSDATLSKFDYVIAGIHTHLQQPLHEMQARMETALSNPYVNIFAHPTGKLLGRPGVMFSEREPFSVPFKTILDICIKNNVAVELNCFPERFDVGVEYFPEILKSGVYVSVGTDSHSAAHLNCLEYAEIMLAQYPKLKKRVINTFTFRKLIDFFKKQRLDKLGTYDVVQVEPKKHDFDYYFGNNSKIISGSDVVIGIDLTGSESKPSGWAALLGNSAVTKAIGSDEELIEESLRYHPKVISIDSPLSYPAGRHCTDPSCECKKYGITRYCERLLSSFGIGVYPCLIPSMEKLTNRGIALAKKFRDIGIDVIESYPGVAQDILSIRRKQNGIDHLKNSYKNFGIKGDYLSAIKITHDELDAIASALVGLFYINDQFVALGNDQENYLIVPSVAASITKPIVIGLTGEIGAGKTTLAEYLRFKHGFRSLRYSAIIQKMYSCDDSRNTLQNIGFEISNDLDKQKELSLEIIKDIESHPNRHYVIDGLRHQVDFDTLSEHFGERFTLLYIKASFNNMFQRYNKRNNAELSKEEFRKIVSDKAEEDILPFMMHCYTWDNVINNNKTFKDYFESVEIKLKEILCQ